MPQIAIIGGGIAGCTTALELAKDPSNEIIIFEKSSDILQGTSARTPGRMGLGYHYFDPETAKLYMKNTIRFMKKYDGCFLGNESQRYLQNGRYFIVNDSLIPLQKLYANFDKMKSHFEGMVREDPSNNIFGTTQIHRAMDPSEFENDVNGDKVAFAVETMELLLDWRMFEQRLKQDISECSNIKIERNFEAAGVNLERGGRFILSGNDVQKSVDYVINCTWQNIEKLNEDLGIGNAHSRKKDPKKSTTSRLKLLAEVSLPDDLKEKHSMFFCVGPHAMFSNVGNGVGRITYAPVTNFGTTTESQMPERFESWLNDGLSKEEENFYGQKIIEGVSEYIPAMREAKLIKVIPGIVKSKGSVDLGDKNSSFHKRDYIGVEEQQIGWVDNAAMKLFYCLGNAEKVGEIIYKQSQAKENIEIIATNISRQESSRIIDSSDNEPSRADFSIEFGEIEASLSHTDLKKKREIFKDFFTDYMHRNFISKDLVYSRRKGSSTSTSSSSDSDDSEKSQNINSRGDSNPLKLMGAMEQQAEAKRVVLNEVLGCKSFKSKSFRRLSDNSQELVQAKDEKSL